MCILNVASRRHTQVQLSTLCSPHFFHRTPLSRQATGRIRPRTAPSAQNAVVTGLTSPAGRIGARSPPPESRFHAVGVQEERAGVIGERPDMWRENTEGINVVCIASRWYRIGLKCVWPLLRKYDDRRASTCSITRQPNSPFSCRRRADPDSTVHRGYGHHHSSRLALPQAHF